MVMIGWPAALLAAAGLTVSASGDAPPAPFGYLYAPAFSLHAQLRWPAISYLPQAGDVLLMSDTDCFWTFAYRLALTGAPGHAGIVVPLPDGRLGVLEAGYNETLWTRITPLAERLQEYPGMIWVRRVKLPLTPEQQERLMAFALAAADRPYATFRVALQTTPLRTRGPLRTFVFGRPRGPGRRYQCAEAVVEALVYAGVRDPRTARPSATYPQDLFYDRSWNPYLDRHPPLGDGWEPPALWTPVLGWALKGRTRVALATTPQPATVVGTCASDDTYLRGIDGVQPGTGSVQQSGGIQQVPSRLVHAGGGESPTVALVEQPLKRIGLFDRPPRAGRRR